MEAISTSGNVLLVLLGFGLLILVHEAGHFFAAKWANIRTDAFAIGFGPVFCSYRKGVGFRMRSCDQDVIRRTGVPPRALTDSQLAEHGIGETEYSLRLFPLGGFVRMLGQDDVDPSAVSSDPRAFNRTPIWKRMIVISAGVIMNIVLAAVLFVIAFSAGVAFEAPVVGSVRPGSPAALATGQQGTVVGLEPGDTFVFINGSPTPTFADVQVAAAMSVPGDVMHMQVRRGDNTMDLQATIEMDQATGLPSLGIAPAASTTLVDQPALAGVLDRTLARVASGASPGPGWSLTGIGPRTDALLPTTSWADLDSASERTKGQPFAWGWTSPQGERIAGMVQAMPQWQQLRYPDATSHTVVGWESGLIGLVPMVEITSVIAGGANDGVLQAGDLVLAFAGIEAPSMRVFREAVVTNGIGEVPIRVERDGKTLDLKAHIVAESTFNPAPKMQVYPGYAWDHARFAAPMDAVAVAGGLGQPSVRATPAAASDITPGARFVLQTDEGLSPWRALWREVHATVANGEVQIPVQTADGLHETVLQVDGWWRAQVEDLAWQPPLPVYLFKPLQVTRSSGGDPLKAVTMGLHETWNFVVLTYVTIDRLFRGTVGVEQLHGPVGIVHLGTRVADRGLAYMLFFLALISVNLAVLNFLPLPIVDGGLMLYLVYEKFKGRPPSIAFQNGAALVGLMLIGTLFVVTFYNDLARLFG